MKAFIVSFFALGCWVFSLCLSEEGIHCTEKASEMVAERVGGSQLVCGISSQFVSGIS